MSRTLDHSQAYSGFAPTAPRPQSSFQSLFRACLSMLRFVIERQRQRKALGELESHMLRDIGISPEEARRAASRPFSLA